MRWNFKETKQIDTKEANISLIRPYSSQQEIYDKNLKGIYWIFFYVQKIKIWFLFPVKKYIAVGEMSFLCSVL